MAPSGSDFPFTPPPPASAVVPPILQEGDPGRVGAGVFWIIPSTGATRARNAANTGWIVISTGGGVPNLAAVLAVGNVASAKIATLTNPTLAQDAATKAYVDSGDTAVAAAAAAALAARTLAAIMANGTAVGTKLTSVTDPAAAQDAATKAYVDSVSGGATLLAVKAFAPGSDGAFGSTGSTSFVDLDAVNAAVTFTAPASTNVLVRLSAPATASGQYFWGLREGAADIGTPFQVYGSSVFNQATCSAAIRLAGIAAGAHTYKWSHRVASGAGSPVLGPADGALVMEVWAAP